MKILVLNCGSSSIKFQLIDMQDKSAKAIGIVDGVGMNGAFMKLEKENGEKVKFEGEILDHKSGIEYALGVLTSKEHGCIDSLDEIDAVGHRVVHGAEVFKSSVLITDEVVKQMEKCIELAPLHNPPNLSGIEAVTSLMPGTPQCGVFDTAFHQTMEEHVYKYAIPNVLYEKYGVRRYGFHGTSHKYVSTRTCEILGLDIENSKIITCHLGNGASVAAIKNGKSIDTSMGMTPVEGLVMGTRCGDLDAGALLYIMEKENIGVKAATALINKHSGVLGVTGGITSDDRAVEDGFFAGDPVMTVAAKMYDTRIRKYIGSYAAVMGGVDAIIFTGGIGENADYHRSGVCEGLEWMGVEIDETKNKGLRGKECIISKGAVKVMVVPTNEELVIANDTFDILTK